MFRASLLLAALAYGGVHATTTPGGDGDMHIDTSFGVPQSSNTVNHDAVARHLAGVNEYMMDMKARDPDLFELCQNRHSLCAFWAISGDCGTNPHTMHALCGPSCQACDHAIHAAGGEEGEEEEEEHFEEGEEEEEEEEHFEEGEEEEFEEGEEEEFDEEEEEF